MGSKRDLENRLSFLQELEQIETAMQYYGEKLIMIARNGVIDIPDNGTYKDLFPDRISISEAESICQQMGLKHQIINRIPAEGCEPLPECYE